MPPRLHPCVARKLVKHTELEWHAPPAWCYREHLSFVKIISVVNDDANGTGAGVMTNRCRCVGRLDRDGHGPLACAY